MGRNVQKTKLEQGGGAKSSYGGTLGKSSGTRSADAKSSTGYKKWTGTVDCGKSCGK